MEENRLIKFEYKDDILIARYDSNKSITKNIAIEMVKERKDYTQGKSVKIVMVFPHLTNMDKGGRDYLSSDDAKEGILATAMVTNSIIGRVIINFFLKLNNKNNQDFPNKVFNNEEDALEWIKKIPLN